MPKDQMRASHILIKKYQKSQEILQEVKNGAKFQDLAKSFSECPSKKKGGDLGYFTKNQMVPEFEKAVLSLKVGELFQEPVKTKFGYHIIKRTG
jgi:peptidyl-prolyl cis-trans isomerase C